MTRYTVVWPGDALDELAELWNSASDRNAGVHGCTYYRRGAIQGCTTKGMEVAEGLRVILATAPDLFHG